MAYNIQTDTTKFATMWDCYQGTGAWQSGNILEKHEREAQAGYDRRVKCFNSPALFRYMIDTFDILWAHSPARVGQDETYNQFTWDAGMGMTLSDLLARGLKIGEVQGSAWVVMDTYADQADDLASMRNGRTFPFLKLIPASDVTGLVVNELGRIVYFSYAYYDYDDVGELIRCIRVYTPGKVTDLDKDGNTRRTADLGASMLPVIPIVPSGEPLRSGYLPASPTLGLYQGQYTVANTNSLIDESIYAQQFSVLVVSGKGDLKGLALGTSNVLKLPEESTAAFISPSGTAIDLMLKRIDQAVLFMQKTFANLLTSGETQSGIAKNIDRQVGTMQLKKLSIYMESIEYAIYETFCAFMQQPPSADFAVEYYKDFDLGAIAEYIADAGKMLDIQWTPETIKAVKEDLIKKYFSGADQDLVVKLSVAEEASALAEENVNDTVEDSQTQQEVIQ